MLYPESNDLAKMSRATVTAAALGMFGVLLYVSLHISYGQNASNTSGLTIDQLRFRLHTLQQLDKDNNAGNLTSSDVNNAHITCNRAKTIWSPDVHVSSLLVDAKIARRFIFFIYFGCMFFIHSH